MTYKYKIPVKIHDESFLCEVEKEIMEYSEVSMKVEEILTNEMVLPFRIRKQVLDTLGLPSNINIGYEIPSEFEFAIPLSCEDLDLSIS